MDNNCVIKLPSPLDVIVIVLTSWYESIYPQQGSEEAMRRRALTVGCSEISKANGTKADKLALIKNKLGPTKQTKAISLTWGHIFEDSCRTVTEVLMDCTIHNAPGSIRHKNGFISCSPDGIGVVRVPHSMVNRPQVRTRDLKIVKGKYDFSSVVNFDESLIHYQRYRKINNGLIDESYSEKVDAIYHNRIALFEFKSPISRDLVEEVPYQYSFQVLTGMNVVDICDYGVYSESRFVSCDKEQFGFNDAYVNFDNGYTDDSLLFHKVTPFMIGCKFFVYKDCVDSETRDELGFTCIESKSSLHYIENNISAVVDYYCIDCCFVMNDEYSSRKLLVDFYTKLCDIGVKACSFDDLAKAYYTYLYRNDIAPLITLVLETYKVKHKVMFAIQLWKLMSNQIVYFNKVIDFADNQLEGATDVIESVRLLNNRLDAEDIIASVPRKRGEKGCVSGSISSLLSSF